MKNQGKSLINHKDLHQLQVGDMLVEMKFSNHKKMEECIVNILKQKIDK